MSFLDRILGRRQEPRDLPRGCRIYSDSTRVLIAATLHDVTGGSCAGEPVNVLPHNAPPAALGDAVLAALGASQGGLSAEEVRRRGEALVKAAAARSLDGLEKRWELIVVDAGAGAGAGDLTVVPMRRYETGGYVTNAGDPEYRRRADAGEIGALVRDLLDRPPQPPQRRAR